MACGFNQRGEPCPNRCQESKEALDDLWNGIERGVERVEEHPPRPREGTFTGRLSYRNYNLEAMSDMMRRLQQQIASPRITVHAPLTSQLRGLTASQVWLDSVDYYTLPLPVDNDDSET